MKESNSFSKNNSSDVIEAFIEESNESSKNCVLDKLHVYYVEAKRNALGDWDVSKGVELIEKSFKLTNSNLYVHSSKCESISVPSEITSNSVKSLEGYKLANVGYYKKLDPTGRKLIYSQLTSAIKSALLKDIVKKTDELTQLSKILDKNLI